MQDHTHLGGIGEERWEKEVSHGWGLCCAGCCPGLWLIGQLMDTGFLLFPECKDAR